MPSASKKLTEGEVVLTARWTEVEGGFKGACRIVINKHFDARDLLLEVPGKVFGTKAEAVNAALRAGMDWVDKEFPLD